MWTPKAGDANIKVYELFMIVTNYEYDWKDNSNAFSSTILNNTFKYIFNS